MTTAKKKEPLGRRMRKNYDCYLFMSGYLLVFFVFTILPVLAAMGLSLTYFNGLESPVFIGLENYKNLILNDDIFLLAVQNTLLISLITGPVGYLLCLVIAWLINDLPPKVRSVMTLLFYAPSLTGGMAFVWTIIFSGDSYGLLNSVLISLGFIDTPIQFLSDANTVLPVCIFVILWTSLGTSFLTFIAGLQGVDKSLYEAAAVDGIRNRYQELWYITLPSIKPQLLFGAVMSITASFNVGDLITQLVGFPSTDYRAHTILHHIQDYGGTRFETGYACAIATILFCMMVLSNQIIQKLIRKVGT